MTMNVLKSLFGGGSTEAITASEAKTLLDGAKPPFVVDVREPSEYATGHIAGAKLMPLGDLDARMAELPKDRQLLCVCASGARSSMATRRLSQAGYEVINLRGGMMGWNTAKLPIKKGK